MAESTNASAAPSCALYQEDIPLLAAEALGEDEKLVLERHLSRCAACRESFESHRDVLRTLRQEDESAIAKLDTQRILAALRQRMALESREAVAPAEVAMSRKGRMALLVVLAGGILAGILALAAVLELQQRDDPETSPLPPRPGAAPIAFLHRPGLAQAKDLYPGDRMDIQGDGTRVSYRRGVDVRLQDGANAGFVSPDLMQLHQGRAAIYAPRDSGGFKLTTANASVEVSQGGEARFLLEAKTAHESDAKVTVTQGRVCWKGIRGASVWVEAGQSAQLSAEGAAQPPHAADTRASFQWVIEHTARMLSCRLSVEKDPHTGRRMGTLTLHNVGAHPVNVAHYHPLGVNYQLEIQRRGVRDPYFEKLSPRTLRKRIAPDVALEIQPGRGDLVLEPGQRYELELDLEDLLANKEVGAIAGHYMGFEHNETERSEGRGWGFTLRSPPLSNEHANP